MGQEFQKGSDRWFISDPHGSSWGGWGWRLHFKTASSPAHMCGSMVLIGLSPLALGVSSFRLLHLTGAPQRINRPYTRQFRAAREKVSRARK